MFELQQSTNYFSILSIPMSNTEKGCWVKRAASKSFQKTRTRWRFSLKRYPKSICEIFLPLGNQRHSRSWLFLQPSIWDSSGRNLANYERHLRLYLYPHRKVRLYDYKWQIFSLLTLEETKKKSLKPRDFSQCHKKEKLTVDIVMCFGDKQKKRPVMVLTACTTAA